ncbi:hypothetical protein Acr_09g0005090 [Actinidia rufa]|uniref:Uncharacterized protein n=1 Tax=Actinidia rufa TaxID=165716 RepID=A0A7J0F628_9ERIC|nr:hypothetical protein Acr_09g0005090 [Actinidia rufa]
MAKFYIGSSSPNRDEKKEDQTREERGKRPRDGEPRKKAFEVANIVFKETFFKPLPKIIDKPYFFRPETMAPSKRNQKYRSLQLKEYIDEERTRREAYDAVRPKHRVKRQATKEGEMDPKDYQLIHGFLDFDGDNELRLFLAKDKKYPVMQEAKAKDLWKKLEDKYIAKSVENHLYLKKKLFRFQYHLGISMIEHLNDYNKNLANL